MRVILVGAVESTLVASKALLASDCELSMIATLDAKLAKRHSDFVDLEPIARNAGAQLIRVGNCNHPEALDAMRQTKPDCVFVIGWSQICGEDFLKVADGMTFGYHPAPLPRMRGRAAIPWTILADEKISGSSLFWMDGGVDTGAILAQEFFHVAPRETASSLYAKHMLALDAIVRRAIVDLKQQTAARTVQDERCATYCAKRTPADGLIDWKQAAESIDRLVRAVGRPYPGAYTTSGSDRLTIWQSTFQPTSQHHALFGQIVEIADDRLVIQTGEGLLVAEDWDFDGERKLRNHSVLGDNL